ncbi:Asp-tRNA(Asn)/Glu-tRNA(Gln) amidotransferase A subunit family amidase [Rhizobium skierniewicense]|nr:Asp-tRNA(Asn)/Glu-tRNA(Gln) amidotransferase A subunit family amidase [Rhizobium skierniewicense]
MPPIPLRGLRIGLPITYFYDDLDADVGLAAETTIRQLANKGVTFVEANIPHLEELNSGASLPIALYEFPHALRQYLDDFVKTISFSDVIKGIRSPDVANIVNAQIDGHQVSRAEYELARHSFRPRLQATYRNYFRLNRLDAILFPTAPLVARPIGHDSSVIHNGSMMDTFKIYVRNVDPSSNAGLPGLSIPVCLTPDRLPVGMEIDGLAGSDQRLLAIGGALEEAIGFRYRPGLPN